jgi:hypothetical protein
MIKKFSLFYLCLLNSIHKQSLHRLLYPFWYRICLHIKDIDGVKSVVNRMIIEKKDPATK